MDLNMPVMDGYQATKKIRELEAYFEMNVKVVGTTANEINSRLIDKCMGVGFNEIISKPVKRDVLTEVIRKFY